MTGKQDVADSFCVELLSKLEAWQPVMAIQALYPFTAPQVLDSYLRALVERDWLVAEHSPAAEADAEYERDWVWGETAGLYHFGIQDPPWLDPAQSAGWMQHVYTSTPPVPLMMTNQGLGHVQPMSRPDLERGVMKAMSERRSVRQFATDAVAGDVLRDCLFAGLGITGFIDTEMPGEEPRLPLKMAPSGGARNPFEGYAYVRRVEGLEPGLYHYSALDNSLGLVTETPAATTTDMFAHQDWTEGAAFALLLVANFERSMWKYPHPNAYRVVLMEAGHIAQNMLLVAAEHGLSAVPSGAVSDAAARHALGLRKARQSLVYGIFIGHPDPAAMETRNFIPHPG